jgi:transcriptional regulator with XRE-family HTH domain
MENEFAMRLRSLRRKYCIKQEALAIDVHCSVAAISYLESGGRLPSPKMVVKLADMIERNGAPTREVQELIESGKQTIIANLLAAFDNTQRETK